MHELEDKLLRSRLFWICLIAAAFLVNGIWLYRHPVNGDVAYYIRTSQRVYEGARLYVDIGDQNFPLIDLLQVPFVALAAMVRLPPAAFLLPAAWLVVAAALGGLFLAVRRTETFDETFAWLLTLLVAQSALFLDRFDFGQRDVLAGFGFLILASNAFLLIENRELRARWRYPLLLIAALMISLKPHFLAPWLLMNIFVAARISVRRTLRSPECWMTVLVSAAHLLVIVVFYPAYWHIAKAAVALYGAYNSPLKTMLFDLRYVFLATWAAFWWKADTRLKNLARLTSLGALGFAIAALQQHKQWNYHYAPAFFLAWVTAAILGIELLRRVEPLRQSAILLLALFVGAWPVFREIISAPVRPDPVQQFAIEKARDKWIVALSTDLWTSYPLILDAHAKSALVDCTLWEIPGLYRDQIKAAKTQTPARFHSPSEMGREEKEIFQEVLDAMQKHPPAVILFQTPISQQAMGNLQFDFEKYFSMDDGFRAALANYAAGPSDMHRQVLYLRGE